MRGWGGERIVGRPIYTDLPIDGIDPAAVTEATSPWAFKDYVDDNKIRLHRGQKLSARLVLFVGQKQVRAAGAGDHFSDAAGVLQWLVCADVRAATDHWIFGEPAPRLLATAELGKSFVSRREVGKPRQRKLVLVGVSDRAQPFRPDGAASLCTKVECRIRGEKPRRVFQPNGAGEAGKSSTRVVERIRKLGFALKTTAPNKRGLRGAFDDGAVCPVSLSTLVVATLNIAI